MAKPEKVTCPQCNGKGTKIYAGKKSPQTCNYCGGTGKVTVYK